VRDIQKGIDLFNECDYFSAHDFFEDIWMDADREERDFYQGLVQVSVGCYHLVCGNRNGAKSQLNKGINKLLKYIPEYNKVNLSELISKLKKILIDLDSNKKNIKDIPTLIITK
jgi:predicted metal-dependent hydrolase